MIKLRETVIVEGKYDKIKLSEIVDTVIIATNGFGVFKDKETLKLIQRMAKETGIIILTDSDAAGFQIRAKLTACIPAASIKHAYIPAVPGKERRKRKHGKEGLLGVEGVTAAVLREVLLETAAQVVGEGNPDPVTVGDLYDLGVTGRENSKQKRLQLLKGLDLPAHLSTQGLLRLVNRISTRTAFLQLAQTLLETAAD